MKKLIIGIAVLSVLGACNNKEKEQQEAQLAAYAKMQAIESAKQQVIDSLRLDSLDKAKVLEEEQKALTAQKSTASKVRKSTTSSSVSSETGYSGTTAIQQKKEGWSDAAKGATIGGLAGAVGGAIIDKKSGRGAVIGGVVGAGTGYVIGREKDKKTGRVQPKGNQ